MANRIELFTAVTLLFLLLPVNESAYIDHAYNKMALLGKKALEHLENIAQAALGYQTGNHGVGSIREPKQHDRLNCSIIQIFSLYMKEGVEIDGIKDDTKLYDLLNDIRHRMEDLKPKMCGNQTADVSDMPFQDKGMSSENLKILRSILELFIKWFSKHKE